MSDTPETDKYFGVVGGIQHVRGTDNDVAFARKLERERDKLKARLPCGHSKAMYENQDGTCGHCAMLLAYEEAGDEVEKLTAQLAEANAVLALLPDTIRHSTWKTPELRSSAATLVTIMSNELIDAARSKT